MENAGALLQMALSLAAVVAMILGLAWTTRRMQGMRAIANSDLRVRSTLAVGLKERVVIVEVQGQQFLIGVAPGQVSMLKALGPAAPHRGTETQVSDASDTHRESALSFGEAFALQLRQAFKR